MSGSQEQNAQSKHDSAAAGRGGERQCGSVSVCGLHAYIHTDTEAQRRKWQARQRQARRRGKDRFRELVCVRVRWLGGVRSRRNLCSCGVVDLPINLTQEKRESVSCVAHAQCSFPFPRPRHKTKRRKKSQSKTQRRRRRPFYWLDLLLYWSNRRKEALFGVIRGEGRDLCVLALSLSLGDSVDSR